MRHPTVTVHGLPLSATLTRVCGGVDLASSDSSLIKRNLHISKDVT